MIQVPGHSSSCSSPFLVFFPLNIELIDFALSVTQLIIACLTDIYKVGQYANIDDWEGTLMLAQLGLKYQDYDLKQQMKEFEEQLRSQTKE